MSLDSLPPRKRRKVKKAARRFARFTGHTAQEARTLQVQWPTVALNFGECIGIMYKTVRDGRTEKYRHLFKRGSRPQLAASEDGKFLILLGGAYQFTERGIVDR